MSTYCIRIYEIKGPDGKWVALGKAIDNYHGFDAWRFEYSDRGLPADSTLKRETLIDEDGHDYTYGHSYVTKAELNVLADNERNHLKEFILRKIHNQANSLLNQKCDFLVETLYKDNQAKLAEYKKLGESDECEEDNMQYFDEEFEEYMQSYDDICSEIYALTGFCESFSHKYNAEHYYNKECKENKEYFAPWETDERIVYYFE